jgi:hypothetical protein
MTHRHKYQHKETVAYVTSGKDSEWTSPDADAPAHKKILMTLYHCAKEGCDKVKVEEVEERNKGLYNYT